MLQLGRGGFGGVINVFIGNASFVLLGECKNSGPTQEEKTQCPHRSSTPVLGRGTKTFLIPHRTLCVEVGGKVGGKRKALPGILPTFR